ncbi:MAG: BLUF domain-containing protein [Planctomycetales bacterium]|nr:BLUF domain-containing protein [Planctomycetales bacterium]MBN8625484.1 BLUF domain-containing protein [Planctomycetota bacterium]
MLQLIYWSRAVRPFSDKELTSLLAKARANNESLGVTGMLVHHRGEFLQVLEGPEATVLTLFETISADARHADVCELVRLNVAERGFAEWSMGFFNADRQALAKTPGFADFFGAGFSRPRFAADPSLAARLLKHFRSGTLAVNAVLEPAAV